LDDQHLRCGVGRHVAGLGRRRRRFLRRQREHEARAAALAILRADRTAMGLDDRAADRKPEAYARYDGLRMPARELVEDRTFAPWRQSRPAVLDVDFDHRTRHLRLDADR